MENINSVISKIGGLTIALALLLLQPFVKAAEPAPEVNPEFQAIQANPPREMPIEEIEVIGERSTLGLIVEIRQVEVQMYEMFNDLNSTDDYDVICRNVIHTSTLIPEWECDAGFMTRERFRNTQEVLEFGAMPKQEEEMYWENRHKVAALNAEMLALAKENPALANAMLELNAKREQLAAIESRKRERATGFFSRLFGKDED